MFTIILPVRDTPEEREYLKESLPAAIGLEPGEIILPLDAPAAPHLIEEIMTIAESLSYEDKIRILAVEKTSDWNFHLAKITWTAYKAAKYDRIYHFDVDGIPTRNVLEGLDVIGTNDIAVYSFTKRLRTKSLSELIRYIFYRYRVMTTDYVFSGNYWVYRPHFFDIVHEVEYRAIYNGIDTYLTEKLAQDGRFNIVTSKKIGVEALTLQNEDYPWRQFQMGIWLAANISKWKQERSERRRQRELALNAGLLPKTPRVKSLPKTMIKYLLNSLLDDPIIYIYLKAFIYQHPYLLKGYKWAQNNQGHEIVKLAKTLDQYEWSYQGAKYIRQIPEIMPKVKGTGSE